MFAGLAKRRSFDLFANKNVKLAERRNYVFVIGVDLPAASTGFPLVTPMATNIFLRSVFECARSTHDDPRSLRAWGPP